MRRAALLSAVLALTGCGPQQSTDELPDDWLEQLRTRPLPGNIATSDEYRISAVFRPGDPVCVADSGGHIHGFYQGLGSPCGENRAGRRRFTSVWADYNAAFESWEEALANLCDAASTPYDLGLRATAGGRVAACRWHAHDDLVRIAMLYLPAQQDQIYTVWLVTDPVSETIDSAELRAFLQRSRLGGSGFSPAGA